MAMPQQSRHQQQADEATGQLVGELVLGVARATALTIEVFLHCDFGSAYVDCGVLGFVLIGLFSHWCQPQNMGPLLWFSAAYGVFWLIAVTNVLLRRWRGQHTVQSRYSGRPHLCRLLPDWREVNVKQVEALLAMCVGYATSWLNKPLGHYLLLASSFLLVRAYGHASQLRGRAVELNDSLIEQKMVAERFREIQDSNLF
jgi:hypothetical protein